MRRENLSARPAEGCPPKLWYAMQFEGMMPWLKRYIGSFIDEDLRSGADVGSSSSSGALPPTFDRQAPLRFHRLPTSAWGLCVPQLWWTAAGADRFPPAAGHPAIRTRRHPRRRSTPESRKPGSKRDRQDLAARPWHEAGPSFGGQRSPCGPARLRLALPAPRGPHHPRRQYRHVLAPMTIKGSPSPSLIRGAQICGNSSDNPRHIGKWGPFAVSPPD